MAYKDQRLGDFLDLVAEQTPAPGGGAVAAVTASLAASLVSMAGTDSAAAAAAVLGRRAAALADEDAAAYSAVISARRAGNPVEEALTRAAEVPLDIAETAAAIARYAAEIFVRGRLAVRGDAATALLLAEGATRAAAYLVEVNVGAGGGDRDLVDRARACIATAQAAHDLAGRRVPVPVEH